MSGGAPIRETLAAAMAKISRPREDVLFWDNPRLDIYKWVTVDGKRKRVKAYPRATSGKSLYKSLCTIQDHYGVRILFCDKTETGKKIVEILTNGY